MARIWNHGLGGQCKTTAWSDGGLCGLQRGILKSKGELAHGRNDAPIPEHKVQAPANAGRDRKRKATQPAEGPAQHRRKWSKQVLRVCESSEVGIDTRAVRLAEAPVQQKKRWGRHDSRPMRRRAPCKAEGHLAGASMSPVQARPHLGYVNSAHTFRSTIVPECPLPFTTLRGRLPASVLRCFQLAPEWRQPEAWWEMTKELGARRIGFEKSRPAVEVYAHARSQDAPHKRVNAYLYGRYAGNPAPACLMAYHHAFMRTNAPQLRQLEQHLMEATQARSPRGKRIFGHGGGLGLNLSRAAFSLVTLQMRWGKRDELEMPRHVDGGPSVLHMSIRIRGTRHLRCEILGDRQGDGQYRVHTVGEKCT